MLLLEGQLSVFTPFTGRTRIYPVLTEHIETRRSFRQIHHSCDRVCPVRSFRVIPFLSKKRGEPRVFVRSLNPVGVEITNEL